MVSACSTYGWALSLPTPHHVGSNTRSENAPSARQFAKETKATAATPPTRARPTSPRIRRMGGSPLGQVREDRELERAHRLLGGRAGEVGAGDAAVGRDQDEVRDADHAVG